MGRRGFPLAPQVRGHVRPAVLEALERREWHVHRIGSAAYVHAPDDTLHLIFGVWSKGAPRPSWAHRLGRASAAYFRRLGRRTVEQRWRRLRRDGRGRFAAVLPWYRFPEVGAYRHEGVRPGWADVEAAELEAHNRAVRVRRGLVAEPTESETAAEWGYQ